MSKKEFKRRWESGPDGDGITNEEFAACAKAWGVSSKPMIHPIAEIRYRVLRAADTNDAEEWKPDSISERNTEEPEELYFWHRENLLFHGIVKKYLDLSEGTVPVVYVPKTDHQKVVRKDEIVEPSDAVGWYGLTACNGVQRVVKIDMDQKSKKLFVIDPWAYREKDQLVRVSEMIDTSATFKRIVDPFEDYR